MKMRSIDVQKIPSTGSYFIYDLDALADHASSLKNNAARLFYACKANPLSHVLKTLHQADIHFDVASEGELHQVLSQGIMGDRILMTGPSKPEKLLRLGLEHHVGTFVIESPSQLFLLETLSKEYDYRPNVLFRLQLSWDEIVGTSHRDHDTDILPQKSILGGTSITPFGMDITTVQGLFETLSLPFLGFHVFQWGNILSLHDLRFIWETTIKICRTLKKDFSVLDVGGGLGIPYKQGDKALVWDDVKHLIQDLKTRYALDEFWLEMGRYMTGPFGAYVTSITDIKRTYDRDIIVLEGGINHIARPALVNESFPVVALENRALGEQVIIHDPTHESSSYKSDRKIHPHLDNTLKEFALHGPLCTSLDFLGMHHLPFEIKIGDRLLFSQVGAYGFTESMPFFLCHDLPGEIIIEKDHYHIVRSPQPASSWMK